MPVIPRPKGAPPAFGGRAMLVFGRWPKWPANAPDLGDEPEIRKRPRAG